MVWASHDDDAGCVSVEIRQRPLKKRCSGSARAGLSRYYAAKSQSFSSLELAYCTQYGTSALALAKRPSSFDLRRHASASPTHGCVSEHHGMAFMSTTHEEEDDGAAANNPNCCPCNDTIFADPADALISPEGSPLQLYGDCSLASSAPAPPQQQQQQQLFTDHHYGLLMPYQNGGYGAGCSAGMAGSGSVSVPGAGGSAAGTSPAALPSLGSGGGALWQSCAALLASGCSGAAGGASACSSGACGVPSQRSGAVLLAGLPSVQPGRSNEWRMNANSSSCCSSGDDSTSSSFSRGHTGSQGLSCCEANGRGESCSFECSGCSSGADCARGTAAATPAAVDRSNCNRDGLGARGAIASAAAFPRSLVAAPCGSLLPAQAAPAGGGSAEPGPACMQRAGLSRQRHPRHAAAPRHCTTGGVVAELSGLWGSTEDLVAALSLSEKRHPQQYAKPRRSPQPTRPQAAPAAVALAGAVAESGGAVDGSYSRRATGEGTRLLGLEAPIHRQPHHHQHSPHEHQHHLRKQHRPAQQGPFAQPLSCMPLAARHAPVAVLSPAQPAFSLPHEQQHQQQQGWQPAQAPADAWSNQQTVAASGGARSEPWACGSAPAPTSMAFFGAC
ncbi:hypothetical protein TSOC_003205 [Tetrabaena socialis]|uniref:Uncharacterized protein n=1 Tax=Tetrabaena socialis TaxID=47790 RepID=A0A2J8AC69_9CHLO|nr:hypothetical protein TSOC_003205 [Tetrabaena socialis]|eukprot:PNH10097.1 hypothetical protein TSOC_003205 [Tetrabaena socialis]